MTTRTFKLSLLIVLLSVTVLLLLSNTSKGWVNITEEEPVALSEFTNTTGFNLTFLSLDIEYDSSIGSNVSTYNYNVYWNVSEQEQNNVNLTSFALVVCPSLRFAIIDHNPLNATLEIAEINNELLLSFELSDFTPPTFNFSIIILGQGSTTEGNYLVSNGSAYANGTTWVPECVSQSGNQSVNCTSDEGTCGNECYDPERYVCLNGFLCPINHLRCGNDCYLREDYVCVNGTKLCPVEAPLVCGIDCYNSNFATCENGVLKTIPDTWEDENAPVVIAEETVFTGEETMVVAEETLVAGEETVILAEETIITGEETVIVVPEPTEVF